MTTRPRKGSIYVYTNSIGGRPIDPANLADGTVIVYDAVNNKYYYVDLSNIYAPIVHTHAQYITEITKSMIEAVLIGTITSHDHTGVYEPVISVKNTAFNKNFGTAAGTVAEGNHTHSEYITGITKAMVEAVLTGEITTHTHPVNYSLPLAANGTRGGLQIGYTATGANLPLLLSSEKGYVTLTNAAIVAGLGFTPYNATNPAGYTSNVGTVTSVSAGNGMYFTTITGSGSVVMGTPSSVTLSSTDAVAAGTHSHAFAPGGTTAQYITGAGTLVTFPTIPTVNNATLTLATSGIATGSQTFTANQSTNATFTVNVPGTNIAEGTRTTTTVPITSSTGTNATLSAATTSLAGVMTAADKTKLDGIAAGAQVNVATNLGYTTAASNGVVTSSTGTNATIPAATTSLAGLMTGVDKTKLDGIATGANNYSLPVATSTVLGGIELFSDTVQSVAANAVSTTASRTYGIQLNSAGQAVVNVPWSDTNTTYSAGNGISLSSTTFSVAGGNGLVQETSGLAMGTPSTLTGATTNAVTSTSHTHAISLTASDVGAAPTSHDHQTLLRLDNRTIAPSELTATYMRFGFGSWANNNTSPYADYFHLRAYQDASGGNDNLVMFRKDAIGMRIFQQTFGSATAYSSYKDVAFTDGSNSTGTWSIDTSGNAATATKIASIGTTFTGTYPMVINASGVLYSHGSVTITGSSGTLTATAFSGSGASLTALNASNLSTGTVPDARLSGTYSGFTHKIDGSNTIFTTPNTGSTNTSARTVYGLAEYRSSGSAQVGAIVFISPNTTSSIMYQFEIQGMLYNANIFKITLQGYRTTGAWTALKRSSLGTVDIQVRFGVTPDGKNCVILGDVGTSWSYPHITIVRAMFSHTGASDAICTGWTTAVVTDLSTYTNVSANIADSPSISDIAGNAATATLAASATKLATARTLTIGSTGKTFDGSANVSWSLAEIGAASTSQTFYIGTTQVAINRSSGTLNLAGIGTFACGVATGTSFNSITGLASANPLVNGTVAVGTSTLVARQDHVHPTDTSRAATNQTMYIGTTAVAINRASAALTLTGVSLYTLTRGTGLTGSNYNGSAAQTWAVSYGTAAGTACQGNDSRLSDARTPTDNSVTYAKLNTTLTSRQAVAASAIDWSLGGVYTKTLTGTTTFTFSNLQLNKVITLVVSGNYTLNLPAYCKKISGTYAGTTTNYIQFHCTNATGGSEEVWYTISKQA